MRNSKDILHEVIDRCSDEEIKVIKDYTKDVKDTNKTIRSVNELNIAVTEFENSAIKLQKENI